MLVSSSDDRNVRVWDPRTGASLAVLRGHGAAVNLVNFAPGDSVAISASEDGTCRVWDLRDRDRCGGPACFFFFCLVGWLIGWLVCWLVLIGWLVGLLIGWLWLVGLLVGWFVGLFVVFLVG